MGGLPQSTADAGRGREMKRSNPQLQNFIVARTMDWLRKHPDTTDVWFGQNDGSPYCTCPDCQAFYDSHGGMPSSIICFVINKLADAVAAEFPHVRVKSLAYAWSRTPPKNMTLLGRPD